MPAKRVRLAYTHRSPCLPTSPRALDSTATGPGDVVGPFEETQEIKDHLDDQTRREQRQRLTGRLRILTPMSQDRLDGLSEVEGEYAEGGKSVDL
jgi:hypothetical protein